MRPNEIGTDVQHLIVAIEFSGYGRPDGKGSGLFISFYSLAFCSLSVKKNELLSKGFAGRTPPPGPSPASPPMITGSVEEDMEQTALGISIRPNVTVAGFV